jgi:ABC-type transporter Mla subunit MlaD
LISAAISILKSGRGQSESRTEQRLAKILGDLTHQIANSSGPTDPAKGQLLDGIAKILKQLAAQQPDANGSMLNTLDQLVKQISHASGLDEKTKNSILDKLSSIIQQLAQSSAGSPCHHSAGHLSPHITMDNGAE